VFILMIQLHIHVNFFMQLDIVKKGIIAGK
jgi:hypothetical protein